MIDADRENMERRLSDALARAKKTEGELSEARESFEDLSAEYKDVSFSLNEGLRDCRMRRLEAETERDKFATQRDSALAEVVALRKENEWRPIEGAPKTEVIDIWINIGRRWSECYYDPICHQWRTSSPSGHLLTIHEAAVTHWRPLPTPPK